MILSNQQIYQYFQELIGWVSKDDLYIPVKANFYIQKNIKLIAAAGEEVEQSRLQIAQHYGTLDSEKNQYIIPSDKITEANKEINDLFSIEQNLDIKTFKLEDLGSAEFTPKQMQAIMFMIEE